mgnify:CR=1 FL=1
MIKVEYLELYFINEFNIMINCLCSDEFNFCIIKLIGPGMEKERERERPNH